MAAPFLPLFQSKVPAILNKPSADHYYRTRSERFGRPLQEIEPSGEELAWVWTDTKSTFGEVDAWMRKSPGKFVTGDSPVFADFVIASRLQGLRAVFGEESEEWQDIETWHDGRWETLLHELKPYESNANLVS
ncbi:hypothetical protein NP233_g12874 [Leucocoprinus birnbaumii]|uniref:Glutathione S-transferase UstS-like C-terminal domain-containing protein n=1 Tax=Leucocoprinus birnbaumii TaxID=56174 RepID=A0AAD5VG43_9AGAR|nr:hypothetical protein NP233_g12874 [Leucocoprinus birnbaumii]